jgi:hypothetical protein
LNCVSRIVDEDKSGYNVIPNRLCEESAIDVFVLTSCDANAGFLTVRLFGMTC